MNLPRRAREAAVVCGLLVVPVLVLRASLRSPDPNLVDRAVLRASAPAQHGVSSSLDAIKLGWQTYVGLVNIQRENQRLGDENRALRMEVSRLRNEAARSSRLEKLLGLRAELPSETLTARVIAVETSPFFRVVRVRLDRGDSDLKAGMPVLVPEGIVGRVARSFGRYSDVLLAVDPKSSIDVILPRTGSRGVVKGVAGENAYRARIDYLLREEDVREGDEIVSSGIGGVFPRGLAVGRVGRVTKRDFGLYQEAEVVPSVDFNRLSEVLVVLAPPPPPDTEPAGHRAPDPNRGIGVPR